jgi:hypothetical protein
MKCKKCNRDLTKENSVRIDLGVQVVPLDVSKRRLGYVTSIDFCTPCSKQEMGKIKMAYPGMKEVA